MFKRTLATALMCLAGFATVGEAAITQGLKVSSNNRYITTADEQPFFWLGCTAWGVPNRASQAQADQYLQDRANRGFTIIQMGAFFLGNTANYYGVKPFATDYNLGTPNSAYFSHVDYIIDSAAAKNLYVAFWPIFEGANDKLWLTSDTVAYDYGYWLGQRYATKKNVIWVLGGDVIPTNAGTSRWNKMAEGITKGVNAGVLDYTKTFMSYHPSGHNSSSNYFHTASWLDFNMVQSYHDTIAQSYTLVNNDYNKTSPIKPAGNGEPWYEFSTSATMPDLQLSAQPYINFLAGGGGYFTYGNSKIYACSTGWLDSGSLGSPGAQYMTHYKNIISSHCCPK